MTASRTGIVNVIASAGLLVLAGYQPSLAAGYVRSPGRPSVSTMATPMPAHGGFSANGGEVLHRDRELGQRIQDDKGHLGGAYKSLEHQDLTIRRQEERDAARHGGTLTIGEAAQLNREENALNAETRLDDRLGAFDQAHPRRAEVLSHDAQLDYRINKDEGHLGGNYKTLENRDQAIRQEEQRDARANGGVITPEEKTQLQQEERSLAEQIRRDQGK